MIYKKIVSIAIAYFSLMLLASIVSAQTTSPAFKFKPVVHTGDAAPVPAQIGSVVAFDFNDQGQAAVVADGGLILKSGDQVTPIVAPGDAAPGGGQFISIDHPILGP